MNFFGRMRDVERSCKREKIFQIDKVVTHSFASLVVVGASVAVAGQASRVDAQPDQSTLSTFRSF